MSVHEIRGEEEGGEGVFFPSSFPGQFCRIKPFHRNHLIASPYSLAPPSTRLVPPLSVSLVRLGCTPLFLAASGAGRRRLSGGKVLSHPPSFHRSTSAPLLSLRCCRHDRRVDEEAEV